MSGIQQLPIAAADLPEDWVPVRRQIIARDGYAIRAGANNTIEANPRHDGDWRAITLVGNVTAFATVEDRDAVLAKLQECRP